MSAFLFNIAVLEKTDLTVTLRITVTYPGMGENFDNKPFILQVLWDEADTRFGGGGPLGDAINVDQISDEEFCLTHAPEYVAETELLRTHGGPAEDNPAYDDDSDLEQLTWGEVRATVTDPRWLTHLTPGMQWDTVSYPI